jgi:hypothetical protein
MKLVKLSHRSLKYILRQHRNVPKFAGYIYANHNYDICAANKMLYKIYYSFQGVVIIDFVLFPGLK